MPTGKESIRIQSTSTKNMRISKIEKNKNTIRKEWKFVRNWNPFSSLLHILLKCLEFNSMKEKV